MRRSHTVNGGSLHKINNEDNAVEFEVKKRDEVSVSGAGCKGGSEEADMRKNRGKEFASAT